MGSLMILDRGSSSRLQFIKQNFKNLQIYELRPPFPQSENKQRYEVRIESDQVFRYVVGPIAVDKVMRFIKKDATVDFSALGFVEDHIEDDSNIRGDCILDYDTKEPPR